MNMLRVGDAQSFVDEVDFKEKFEVQERDEKILSDPVAAQLDAYNSHDLGRFLACFADDVEFLTADGETMFQGRDQLAQVYAGVFEDSKVHCKVTNRLTAGEWVVDEQHVSGIGDDKETVIALYRVQDGSITQVRLLR